jgi:3-hexulose-6-phosphate synthase/6-phospho-3-hexuloisomerase
MRKQILIVLLMLFVAGVFLRAKTQPLASKDDILAQLREIPSSTLADAVDEIVGKRAYMSYDMRPVSNGRRMAGRAKTVLYGPLSENVKEKAVGPQFGVRIIDESGPGDVMVAVTGDLNVTGLGGLMATTAQERGMEGVVVDGAIRDVDQIEKLGLPVFTRSISPSTMVGRYTSLARDIPVACGGVTVYPGDYIVGDRDGVVSIPAGQVQAVLRRAQEMEETERKMMPLIQKWKSLQKALDIYKRI